MLEDNVEDDKSSESIVEVAKKSSSSSAGSEVFLTTACKCGFEFENAKATDGKVKCPECGNYTKC